MIKALKQMFNEPLNFFDKKRSLRQGFLFMLVAMLIFVSMNQLMIYFGFVKYTLKTSHLLAIIVNFINILTGYFVVTALCVLPMMLLGGKKIKELFTVVSYSLVPLAFFWIPHIIPQVVMIIIHVLLMTTGVSRYEKISKKKGLLIALIFLAFTILISYFIGNFVLLPYQTI